MSAKTKGYLMICYLMTVLFFLGAAAWGSRAVTAIQQKLLDDEGHTVIVDAGHGGVDGGAISCTGIPESRFNLEIAIRCRDLLQFLGIRTEMIRTRDESVYTRGDTIAEKKISDLKERVRRIVSRSNAIVISIHQNSFPDSRYWGAQTFYNEHPQSKILAKKMQESFLAVLNPGSRRTAKPSRGVYLMDHISCPAVLAECGFLSNPKEEALLRSEEYQKQVCCVIAAAVSQFLSSEKTCS